jgi:arsenite methyltransferase
MPESCGQAAHPDYGVDAPRWLGGWLVLGTAAAALALSGRLPPPLRAGTAVFAAWALGSSAIWIPSSRLLKVREAERLVEARTWRGDELVLDAGCGRGLFLNRAARRLTTGLAIGVDNWQSPEHAGDRGSAALDNAAIEGVADRVRLCDGDARQLPFRDAAFDVVLSSFSVHDVSVRRAEQRTSALREMVRVLKPGGELAIIDIVLTLDHSWRLRALGMDDVRHRWRPPLWGLPVGTVTARKPAPESA